MSMIFQNDPEAIEKLQAKLLRLEGDKLDMQMQNRKAKALGLPKNPPYLMGRLNSAIRQTKQRLASLDTGQGRKETARPWS